MFRNKDDRFIDVPLGSARRSKEDVTGKSWGQTYENFTIAHAVRENSKRLSNAYVVGNEDVARPTDTFVSRDRGPIAQTVRTPRGSRTISTFPIMRSRGRRRAVRV